MAATPPSSFKAPARVAVGQEYQPDATPLTRGGRALTFTWDYQGDGKFIAKGPRPVPHRFRNPGKYKVLLKVYDRRFQKESVSSQRVEVTP